jgi:predicted transcriptional regulator
MSEPMRETREIIRDEMMMRDRLLAVLEEGPKTVPEIAAALGAPSHEVMQWVMAARKYGHLEESSPTDDGYSLYGLKAKE